jgi:hypothetical protein
MHSASTAYIYFAVGGFFSRYKCGDFSFHSTYRKTGFGLLGWVEKLYFPARSTCASSTIVPSFATFNATIMSSKQTLLPNRDVPIAVIDTLLGQGLGYDEWETRLRSQGYGDLWNENLKNIIIKREFEYFKDEILRLRGEPNTASKGKDVQKTNSSESIMKRLQGQEWAKGKRGERDQRMKSKRLLGKDAK